MPAPLPQSPIATPSDPTRRCRGRWRVRTVDGDVLADLGPVPVRVYEWVDLLAPDIKLAP